MPDRTGPGKRDRKTPRDSSTGWGLSFQFAAIQPRPGLTRRPRAVRDSATSRPVRLLRQNYGDRVLDHRAIGTGEAEDDLISIRWDAVVQCNDDAAFEQADADE